MKYQTYEPVASLSTLVRCYWTLESPIESPVAKQTIVPDGCMEMIFHYGDLYKQYSQNGSSIIQPRCFVIGQLTQPLEIEPTGVTGIFAVRFQPNGFFPFATVPIKEMANTAVPFGQLFGAAGKATEQDILNACSALERIQRIERFLSQLLTDTTIIDHIASSVVATILSANGQRSVDEVAQQSHINRRSLERKFSKAIGLSPKQLSKIIRLQAMLKILLSKQFSNFTDLAYKGEYYDQAHFIRDFKELTGFTPKEFYGNNLKMSSLFYGTD